MSILNNFNAMKAYSDASRLALFDQDITQEEREKLNKIIDDMPSTMIDSSGMDNVLYELSRDAILL